MIEVYSEALDKTIRTGRVIGKINGHKKGPTMVFFGGVHGNETAGVFALHKVFNHINPKEISGTLYAITGNISALEANKRYVNNDLNRLWKEASIEEIKSKTIVNSDEAELLEIFDLIQDILNKDSGPFYFIDFHTTSSKTIPFITINDALINRKFAKQFPVPVVLGIEEYLEGPLLSYINELGYVSLGFESGQHTDKEAIINCESFIYLSLAFSKAMSSESIVGFPIYYKQLQDQSYSIHETFEITHLHSIKPDDNFIMAPGFKSFQIITKNMLLAHDSNGEIRSRYNARIFMPLYQKMGKEGFFIIQKIKPVFLKLSEILRRLKFDGVLVLLPGVSWQDKRKKVLQVNLKIARFFAKSFFHLLGYRSQTVEKNYLMLFNRERTSLKSMYKHELWYKKSH
ncbi:aspartoacylase [Hanstruepera neustonica]|uniref:Aspartoacylase n=1 Tax=Hanstruepera neustonica TaxID=1445657 RepID=A0A2K1E3I9_9FLAO|nr:succinylglutamate desuccinylase/aspartoacylase family protein [Hanstruepera neustonica]PNQ74825.1 aspartoacylase [Hanstruepera neustonica]